VSRFLDDAKRVVLGVSTPTFRRQDYEEAMLDLARAEAWPGENVNQAFARLCSNGDKRMDALYAAACVVRPASDEGAVASEGSAPKAASVAKRMADRDRIWQLMLKTARHERRQGESVQKALDRLLETDEVIRDAYSLYCEGG
jgi:hypothetical protein